MATQPSDADVNARVLLEEIAAAREIYRARISSVEYQYFSSMRWDWSALPSELRPSGMDLPLQHAGASEGVFCRSGVKWYSSVRFQASDAFDFGQSHVTAFDGKEYRSDDLFGFVVKHEAGIIRPARPEAIDEVETETPAACLKAVNEKRIALLWARRDMEDGGQRIRLAFESLSEPRFRGEYVYDADHDLLPLRRTVSHYYKDEWAVSHDQIDYASVEIEGATIQYPTSYVHRTIYKGTLTAEDKFAIMEGTLRVNGRIDDARFVLDRNQGR